MNVNKKGSIGLLKVMLDLYSKDHHCFTPEDDYSPVDVIAMDKSGNLNRIQVKYRSVIDNRKYVFTAFSVVNGQKRPVNRELIDCWAVYLAEDDIVVYLPVSLLDGKTQYTIHRSKIGDFPTIPPLSLWKLGRVA